MRHSIPSKTGASSIRTLRARAWLRYVIQSILGNPVECNFNVWSASIPERTFHAHGQPRPARDPLGEKAEGRHQSQIIQDSRVKFVRKLAQLASDLFQGGLYTPQALARIWIHATVEVAQRQLRPDKKLPSLIVYGVRNPMDLVLEGFIHPTESRNTVAVATMRHLVWREAFCKERATTFQRRAPLGGEGQQPS